MVRDSSKAERETMYRSMVPGDSELSMKLLDGPASSTRWMEVPEDPPFQCSMMGAVEQLDQGRCTMSITINVLIDSGQNVLEGVVVSENFISLLGLTAKDLIKKGVRNISTADPKGPGLKVIGRVKRGLMGIRFCEHESVFVQPLVVQGLANEVNVGLVFMSAVDAKLNFALRSVEFGKHCTRPLAKKHTEGYRLTRQSGRSKFSYRASSGINSILFSNVQRPSLRMQRTGDRWEAILEGNVNRGDAERLAVDSGPLPESLVGTVFIPYRPDIAPTRVGRQGLVLVVPTREWRDGEVVGRLKRRSESPDRCVRDQESKSSSRTQPRTDGGRPGGQTAGITVNLDSNHRNIDRNNELGNKEADGREEKCFVNNITAGGAGTHPQTGEAKKEEGREKREERREKRGERREKREERGERREERRERREEKRRKREERREKRGRREEGERAERRE